ncbi:MAG: hypothetical protein JW759_07230 [Candidatus Coatesbacteria bacterium]|nr:hypothetical protein [Candidatus Coatesbacteria bacterium]
MTKKCLIVLSVCMLIGAGIAVYAWASCCSGDALCNGGVINIADTCNFYFTVQHNRQDGDQQSVKVWVQKDGDLTAFGYMMQIYSDPPYTFCVTYQKTLLLAANSTYYYWFTCTTDGCTGRDPNQGAYTLLTGDCD